MIMYFNGNFIEDKKVRVSPFDRGFQYADGVYEVLRTYNKKYFMVKEHLERLKYSLKETRISGFDNYDSLEGIFNQLIKKNALDEKEVTVYLQITRGDSFPRAHRFPDSDVKPTVVIMVSKVKLNPDLISNGVRVITEKDIRWSRCDIKSISLLPSVLINQKANENGAHEAIWIRDGYLTEGTHTNFYGVKDGKVYSYPLSNYILPGVTRIAVIEICRKLNIDFVNEGVKENNIKEFDEFFITGTTTEIMPVTGINNYKAGSGKPGVITKKLQNAYYEFVKNYR